MRKSFTRLFGFLLLNVMMLFSYGLYAQDGGTSTQTQSTIELKAATVTQCYGLVNSYSADVQVKDFIAMKSFDLTLKYDPAVFGVVSVVPVTALQTSGYSWSITGSDPVTGKLNIRWSSPTAVTYANNAFAKLFTVNLSLLNPSNTATSYASTLVWDSASYFYYSSNWAAGTTYQTNTTALTNGSITVPVNITAAAIQTAVTSASCYGSNALIAVTSPVGSGYMYYFNGSTGSASPTVSAFAPSTNTVVVVDNNGCASQAKTVAVSAPTQLSFTAAAKDATCNGGNGSITFSPVGSTAPYSYWVVPSSDWSYFQNKLFYSNLGKNDPDLAKYKKDTPQVLLPIGAYYINVNSATDCNSLLTWFSNTANPAWQVVGIGQPAAVSVATSSVDATCTTKGSITASVSGGTSSPAGSYLVSIDNVNWKQVTSATSTVTFNNLNGGTYTVTAIDSKGCVGTSVVTIDTPDPIVFTLGYTDASCFNGTTGTISITSVSGGGVEASYEYAVQLQSLGATPLAGATWSSTSVVATGLAANYYSVFVRDNYGCTATYSNSTLSGNIVPIQNPAEFKFTTNASAGAVACNGGSYTLTVTATGGVTPYVYSFDGGTTTTSTSSKVFTNLTSDTTVSVTVTDSHGCSLSQAVVITVPATLTATISTTDVVLSPTCPGGNDGRVTILATGGTAPYEYSTDGANFDGKTNVLLISEGLTTITVRDKAFCKTVLTATAATLTPTTLSAVAEGKIACHGSSTGRIQVTNTWQAGRTIQYLYASSAAAVYSSGTAFNPYMINGSANTATPTTFAAGTYYIGAKDQMDCSAAVTSVTISENPALTATVATTNATCYGKIDGSITINTLGGNGAPTYAIANTFAGATNMPDASFQSLDTYSSTTTIGTKVVGASRGTYYVVLKDACGRSSVFGPYTVDGYKAITFNGTVAKTVSTCAGSNNGTITVPLANVHGGKPEYDGTGLYTFTLTKPSAATVSNTTGSFTGLAGGLYTVTITDASGCSSSSTISVSLTDPDPVVVTDVLVKNISCKGANNGEITVTAKGGVPTYALAINSTIDGSWLPFSSSSALSKTYVATQPGIYTLYVKDANGCYGNTVSVTVSEPAALTASVTVSSVTCASGGTGTATVKAIGGWGSTVTSTYIYGVGTTTSTVTNVFAGLTPGVYVASVTDNTGSTVSVVSTASATITYTYPQISCTGNTNFTVNPLMPYLYTGQASPVKCFGGNDGALVVTVLQGSQATTTTTGDEYYVQLTSTATPMLNATDWKLTTNKKYSFNGLVHGHYTVWISSANTVAGTVSGTNSIYNQGACVLPVGSEPMNPNQTGPYMYAESWEVQEPGSALTASATWTSDVACTGGNGGSFTVNAAGGSSPYSYSSKLSVLPAHVFAPDPSSSEWQASTVFANKVAGTWIVWAKDANGCIVGGETDTTTGLPVDQWRVAIKQPLPITFTAVKNSDVSCYGSNDGKITLTPSDATRAPFTYVITGTDYNGVAVSITGTTTSAVQSTYVVTGLPANTTSGTTATNVYTVSITDRSQCTSTSTTVNSPIKQAQVLSAPLVKAAGSFLCPGDVSGVIESQVSGGVPTYTYQLYKDGAAYTAWVNYPSFIVEVGHTWSVVVKDANGCTASGTIELKAPVGITATMQETTCFSDPTASVIVKAVGEVGRTFSVQYKANTGTSYSAWQNFDSQIALSGFIFANSVVTQNFYYFNVKDNMGCTTSYTYSFVATQNELKASVAGVGGSATLTITGGITPYSYQVGTASATTLAGSVSGGSYAVSGLVDGTNSITVYDAHGCSKVVTYAADLTAPTLVGKTPTGTTADNFPALVANFSENVAVGAGNVKIVKASDGSTIVTIPASAITVSGSTATLTYPGGLDKDTQYYVTIDAGVVKDLAGNNFAGVTASTTWTFKTGPVFATGTGPDVNNSLEFKVYPNPFVDFVTIDNASDLSKVVVSNIAGQVVKEVAYPTATVQLSELRSGVYFITLYQDDKVVSTVKLLKR